MRILISRNLDSQIKIWHSWESGVCTEAHLTVRWKYASVCWTSAMTVSQRVESMCWCLGLFQESDKMRRVTWKTLHNACLISLTAADHFLFAIVTPASQRPTLLVVCVPPWIMHRIVHDVLFTLSHNALFLTYLLYDVHCDISLNFFYIGFSHWCSFILFSIMILIWIISLCLSCSIAHLLAAGLSLW